MPHCISKASKQMLNWESVWKMKPKSIHVRHLKIQLTVWSKIWFFATFTRSSSLCPYLLFTYTTICILIDFTALIIITLTLSLTIFYISIRLYILIFNLFLQKLITIQRKISTYFRLGLGFGLGFGLGLVYDLDVMSFVSPHIFLDYSV